MATFTVVPGGFKAEVARLGVRKSKTFPRKRQAELWAAEVEMEILKGRRRAGEGKATLHEVLGRYALEKSPLRRGMRWEQVRLAKLQREMPFVGKPISEITPDMLAEWRDTLLRGYVNADGKLRRLQPESVRREFGLLGAVFQTAMREWNVGLHENPMRAIDRPAKGKARSRRITDAEVERLCKALGYVEGGPVLNKSQETAIALMVAVETAMRAGELLSLTRGQVDFEKRVAHLERTKNGDERFVPLSSRAVQLLKMLPGEDRLFTVRSGSLDMLFRTARDRIGIPDVHFHDSRREATSRLSTRFHVLELAKITGHKDVNLLNRVYYKPDVADLVAKLD